MQQVLNEGPSDIVTPTRLAECGIKCTWSGGAFKGEACHQDLQLTWDPGSVHKDYIRPEKLIRTVVEIPIARGSGPALYIYAKVIRGWYDCVESQNEHRVIEQQ